jgi:hypothetical protein
MSSNTSFLGHLSGNLSYDTGRGRSRTIILDYTWNTEVLENFTTDRLRKGNEPAEGFKLDIEEIFAT